MRVTTTEDRVDLDDLLLEIERLQIVSDRHQVCFGWQLVGRAAPVCVGKRTQLTGFNKAFDLVLHVPEIAG